MSFSIAKLLREKGTCHISRKKHSSFLTRLSDLLEEGYTFHDSIKLLLPFYLKDSSKAYERIVEEQKKGSDLIEVFKILGFPSRIILPIHLSSVHGLLEDTTRVLAKHSAMYEKTVKRMRSLLIYPLCLFIVIFFLFAVFRMYFLPNMESLFSSRNATNHSLFLSNFLLNLPNLFFLLSFLTIFFLYLFKIWLDRKDMELRRKVLHRIPIIGDWQKLIVTHLFAREMGTLLESGLSLQNSLSALISQHEDPLLKLVGEKMELEAIKGNSFCESVINIEFFTADFPQFISHGENSGYLGRELTLYSDVLADQIEVKLTQYLNILQPVLFLILALFIMGAYLSILLPLYKTIDFI